jgi:hypothetical protein
MLATVAVERSLPVTGRRLFSFAITLLLGRGGDMLRPEFNQTIWAALQRLPSSFGSIPNS